MIPSDVRREGDDFLVEWAEVGVGLELTGFRQSDAGLWFLARAVVLPDRKGLMGKERVNLYTGSHKKELAKKFVQRCGFSERNQQVHDQWTDGIEAAFSAVIDRVTTPDPLVILGKQPRQERQGYLVWPFLARNQVNILLANQGAGKSYIGLAIAQAVSAGCAQFLPEPFRLLGKGPVIYYDAETDLAAQQERQWRLAAALGLKELPDIHYRHVKPPLADYAAILRRDVAEVGAVLVIFDSLTFLSGGNLNDSEVAVPTMNAIGECGEHATKLALAHHGKAGREPGAKPSVIGFSGFEFKSRSIWLVRRMNEDGEGVDHIDQAWTNDKTSDDRLHKGFGLRMAFDEDNTRCAVQPLSFKESPWLAKTAGSPAERIRAALLETELWKDSAPNLAKTTGLSERHIRRVAAEMDDIRAVAGGRGKGNVSVFELWRSENDVSRSENPKRTDKTDTYSNGPFVRFPSDGQNGQTDKTDRSKTDNVHFNERARARLTPEPGRGDRAGDDDLMNLPF